MACTPSVRPPTSSMASSIDGAVWVAPNSMALSRLNSLARVDGDDVLCAGDLGALDRSGAKTATAFHDVVSPAVTSATVHGGAVAGGDATADEDQQERLSGP